MSRFRYGLTGSSNWLPLDDDESEWIAQFNVRLRQG